MSQKWLGGIFVKETGRTVNNYINEIRMGQAKKLLKETSLGITDIAMKVGFSNLDILPRMSRHQMCWMRMLKTMK